MVNSQHRPNKMPRECGRNGIESAHHWYHLEGKWFCSINSQRFPWTLPRWLTTPGLNRKRPAFRQINMGIASFFHGSFINQKTTLLHRSNVLCHHIFRKYQPFTKTDQVSTTLSVTACQTPRGSEKQLAVNQNQSLPFTRQATTSRGNLQFTVTTARDLCHYVL